MAWRTATALIVALAAPAAPFVLNTHAATLTRRHAAEREGDAPPEEAKRPSNNKAAFSVYRCDNFAECRETVVEDTMEIKYRAAASDQVMLVWQEPPRRVLLLTKPIDQAPELLGLAAKCAALLARQHGVQVCLEPDLHRRLAALAGAASDPVSDPASDPALLPPMSALEVWHGGPSPAAPTATAAAPTATAPTASVDLVVTLGGDGLLMHANSLFPRAAPPVLALAGGSLGFLAPFDMGEMASALASALASGEQPAPAAPAGAAATGGLRMSLRMRLCCAFLPPPPLPAPAADPAAVAMSVDAAVPLRALSASEAVDREWEAAWAEEAVEEAGIGAAEAAEQWTVLNEVVVERGASPYLAQLEVYVGGVYLTTMQADGAVFSTPTGSTAYSLSAGGSMVHPAVPAVLLTPICPHSLSCRPMLLPDSAVVVCRNSERARSDAWVSFDGKHRRRLRRGQSLKITMSSHPLPTVNRVDDTADWFHGIASAFHFNERPMQRPLTPPNAV